MTEFPVEIEFLSLDSFTFERVNCGKGTLTFHSDGKKTSVRVYTESFVEFQALSKGLHDLYRQGRADAYKDIAQSIKRNLKESGIDL